MSVFSSTRVSLIWVLENPGITIVVLLLTLALNVLLFIRVPKGFFPEQDTGIIFGGLQGPYDASFTTRDAVVSETPARSATSCSVTRSRTGPPSCPPVRPAA